MKNYLYPFFWQHGESEDVIREYMDKISESGMRAVCIEARPHPEFVADGWWHDMSVIIEKAKEKGMKLWILDDSHFPTGYANGRIARDYPGYKKLYLYKRRFDVVGPMKGARINAGILVGRPWDKPGLGDKKIIGVYLARRSENNTQGHDNLDAIDAESIVELKDSFMDRIITLDIPSGSWSVFVVFTTHEGGEEATKDYLNPLMAEATQVLIDEVYEPHYQHFGSEFGSTITAFFSDEPRFGNRKGTDAVIGTDMVLPWRAGMAKELPFAPRLLPLLWVNANGAEKEIRYLYMDFVTKQYSDNFSGVLAKWCNEHGLLYLGHNIEDEGAHCRLGYGAGHYFRAQKMQDYAGVDVIGTQIMPGMPYHHDAFSTGGNNGEFYHYALGKLAGSAAHLDPKKNGRAVCEVFGAYGWNEGLKLMKWLTDHLISRGINTLVPHAFDPKTFPDWDCPPHFYAHGNNPQFRYFPVYTSYANRLLDLFNGGKTAARIGVLYNGEIEWYNGKCMPIEKVLRKFAEHQIDADIISEDYLDDAVIENGMFFINGVGFSILVIPENHGMPHGLEEKICNLAAKGVRIITIQADASCGDIIKMCDDVREIRLTDFFPELYYYHYIKREEDIYFFFNESVTECVDTVVSIPLPDGRRLYRYDAFTDHYYETDADENVIRLMLQPYESAAYVAAREKKGIRRQLETNFDHCEEILSKWTISYADPFSYPNASVILEGSEVLPVSSIDGYDDKAGTAIYETDFYKPLGTKTVYLDLGAVYETAEVFVNGSSAGIKIAPPYCFDISALLKEGKNALRIEVTNTLGAKVRDGLSQYMVIEPFGMTAVPKLIW